MPAYYTSDRKFDTESWKQYKDPHLSFQLQKEHSEPNAITKRLLNELTKYRENIIYHVWGASIVFVLLNSHKVEKSLWKILMVYWPCILIVLFANLMHNFFIKSP